MRTAYQQGVCSLIRIDTPLFYRTFPELKSASVAFLKLQWAIVGQYITGQADVFTNPGINDYMQLLAHVVKLNLMAQAGMKIDGVGVPLLPAPNNVSGFRNWLNQTQYGQSIG